jgi:hypothetical protein
MRGRCLCGAVQFEVASAGTPIGMCHCSKCRRVSGVASNAEFMVATHQVKWVSGEELATHFALPDGWRTAFCSVCGSPLPKLHPTGGAYWVPAGLIDEPSGLQVAGHIFVGSKASWDDIAGDAPQFEADFSGLKR